MLERMRMRARIRRLNRVPGVRIASSVHLARGAMIQTASDGVALGGRIVISDRVAVSDGAVIASYGGSIEIGEHAYVGPYCVLYGHGGLTLGRNTMIGAHTVIIPANHGFARLDMPMVLQPLTKEGIAIGDDVWIGANCSILDGVRIGDHAIVGAGSVVTKDIDAYGIAYGVPATTVRDRRDQAR